MFLYTFNLRLVTIRRGKSRAFDPDSNGDARKTSGGVQVALDRQVHTCLFLAPMSDLFDALAAPARRAILDELTARDGQTLFELCGRLAMRRSLALTRQAISQHLDVLESA